MDDDGELSGYEKARGAAIEKAMNEEEAVEEAHCGKRDDDEEGVDEAHCGKRDDDEGEELEEQEKLPDGPSAEEMAAQTAVRRKEKGLTGSTEAIPVHFEEGEELEEQQPLKEWYNDTLHEALLRKFKIKK